MFTLQKHFLTIANHLPFTLIAGPCQIESMDHSLFMAEKIKKITDKLNIQLIYKSSFDKANRTNASTARGVGLAQGLKILNKVQQQFACPIITDVHCSEQVNEVAQVADILQIPAFLCRQTDLIEAVCKSGRAINVKKGQFLAPSDMHNVYNKCKFFGAQHIMLTERGACFGYNNLVFDLRSLAVMKQTGAAVIFDATHSVQKPGALTQSSGGDREYIALFASAAVTAGIAGIFMEVHQDPENAPSDGHCMLPLEELENTLMLLKKYDTIAKELMQDSKHS
ncbi:2-dehydro-3-deoxyphosphooctonate aldolase [Rickettsiales endosymbiont of Paramecium tredecaurelia]|uniref:3-deoxy-8-phosphooctulonate synthase n=1 Tax=Candidatus Sarmatiella mevalonica TaxID=2770581 RepID=UPI00192229F1|nr:3-deoxy-8-phosphooctulonate synthase [Candidatus Sarmatiella mevalonica]MBL3284266.1 2-dehydro-3-deoxyphosphooctonate aldolase [Candidatus Sarmatiella mevalonica]